MSVNGPGGGHSAEKIGRSTSFDADIWADTVAAVEAAHLPIDEIVDNFPLFVRRIGLAKFIAHVMLFREIVDLPGSIVECGVFKGASLLTFVKLVEVLCPGDSLKRVIGFDTFSGFVSLAPEDGAPDESRRKVVGGWNAGDFLPTLERVIDVTQHDSMVPRVKRVELVKGDIRVTVPQYVKEHPGLRICLLHLDVDLYEPTLAALEHLYPLVVPGGIVVLDEYAMPGFPGETAAFDRYFGDEAPKLVKFPFTPTPGGYFRKA